MIVLSGVASILAAAGMLESSRLKYTEAYRHAPMGISVYSNGAIRPSEIANAVRLWFRQLWADQL